MQLRFLCGDYSICQLSSGAEIPAWATNAQLPEESLFATLRTHEELTIIAPSSMVAGEIKSSPDWCCFRVVGALEFDLVGVIAGISRSLAVAKIPIFSLSTYNTDYFLVARANQFQAQIALCESGYEIQD